MTRPAGRAVICRVPAADLEDVKRWLERNPPPGDWRGTRLQYAALEMPFGPAWLVWAIAELLPAQPRAGGTFPGDLDRMPSGHTRHCEARQRWGDGECECGKGSSRG